MWLEVFYETINSKGQIDLIDGLFLLILFFYFWTGLTCSTSCSLIVAIPSEKKEVKHSHSISNQKRKSFGVKPKNGKKESKSPLLIVNLPKEYIALWWSITNWKFVCNPNRKRRYIINNKMRVVFLLHV